MKARAGLQKFDAIDMNNGLKIFNAWVSRSIVTVRHPFIAISTGQYLKNE